MSNTRWTLVVAVISLFVLSLRPIYIYFRTNKISQIKYYIVYNTGTYVEWDVTYTLENDTDIAKSLEAFRS